MGQLLTLCFPHRGGDSKYEIDEVEIEPKTYSWDKRGKLDPKQYMFIGISGQTVAKLPGEINGQQFIIQNCKDAKIYLFDHSAALSIDDCTNCEILIGPCRGSVFIRDCTNCRLLVACQQLRTRDCRDLSLVLHCATQPIIEASTNVRFGCLQWNYPKLHEQYAAAGLSVFSNSWSNVHDFTPVPGQTNYSLLPEDTDPFDLVPISAPEGIELPQISANESIVPLTSGSRPSHSEERVFALLFSDVKISSYVRALKFIAAFKDEGFKTVQTREVVMKPDDIVRITGIKSLVEYVELGPVVSVEITGDGCRGTVDQVAAELMLESTALIPEDGLKTSQLMHAFHSYADMNQGM